MESGRTNSYNPQSVSSPWETLIDIITEMREKDILIVSNDAALIAELTGTPKSFWIERERLYRKEKERKMPHKAEIQFFLDIINIKDYTGTRHGPFDTYEDAVNFIDKFNIDDVDDLLHFSINKIFIRKYGDTKQNAQSNL